jgi:putative ABC transport system substrate-binding protein
MKRRDFIKLLGGAATALPFRAALAQQQMPLVGFLNSASPDTYRFNADSFREGLTKAGFEEGKNIRIEERWAQGDYSALPALAAELVAKGVVAIAATGDVASARCTTSEQHSTRGLYDRRRPRWLWTGRKHKSPRRERNGHPFQPKCTRRKTS